MKKNLHISILKMKIEENISNLKNLDPATDEGRGTSFACKTLLQQRFRGRQRKIEKRRTHYFPLQNVYTFAKMEDRDPASGLSGNPESGSRESVF